MILLVSGLTGNWAKCYADAVFQANAAPSSIGFLNTPRGGHTPESVFLYVQVWAADNDCFQGFDRPAYEAMLKRWRGAVPGPLWVAAPDVVADSAATLANFEKWEPLLHDQGYPVALVLQDGQQNRPIPWAYLEGVFLGGSTSIKLSDDAGRLCQEARRRGKWVHMGRVNSRARMEVAARFGCHSVDGSGFSRWKKLIRPGVRWLQSATWKAQHQGELFPLR